MARASEITLQAKLIWGTNDETSPDPSHKKLDTALARKLRKVFKWNNYFEVNRQSVAAPLNAPQRLVMSHQCFVEVNNLGNSRVEVKLYGEGKLLSKSVQKLTPGEDFVQAGEDKNDTAWFVVVRSVENP